jgi:fructokinase
MNEEGFLTVGLGELIWDVLPEGKQLGGAPTNFAYVSRLVGDRSTVASRVGTDAWGSEALMRLDALGVETAYVQQDDEHPTGKVGVRLDERGEAIFEVNQNSAWDYLAWTREWQELAARADAVCFGTLGQRAPQARAVINSFLRATRPDTLRVFDVNLRHSFFDASMLSDSLSLARVVKLNSDELPLVASMLSLDDAGDEAALSLRLLRDFPLELVAVTRGARGSLLVSRDEQVEHEGFRVRVADTIGAGDAFAAALTHQLLRRAPLVRASRAANWTGAWVASRCGATPEVDVATFRHEFAQQLHATAI